MACGCEDATVQLFTQTDSKVRIVFPMYTAKSIKGELNPKIKFVLFERIIKNTRVSYLSAFDSLASFLRYFSFFDMNVIYLCYYKTKSLRNNHVRVFLPRHQTCTFWSNFVL